MESGAAHCIAQSRVWQNRRSSHFFSLSVGDQQAFACTLDLATNLFLDRDRDSGFVDEAVDFWNLYRWTRRIDGYSLWSTEDGTEAIEPPPLQQLTPDDWRVLVDDLKEHFLGEGEDEYIEMPLLDADQQPHWPTFQEFRSAKAHLLDWCSRTRVNSRSN